MRRWNAGTFARPFSAREDDPGDTQELMPQSGDGNPDSYPELFGQSTEPDPETFPRRVPNLGHALLFVCFAGLVLLISQIILFALGESPVAVQGGVITIPHPKLQLAALAGTYLTTLLAAWLFYPVVWQRAFLDGLRWHGETARRQAPKLIALGLLLGAMVQVVTYFITTPKSSPIDDFFLTPSNAWLITVFGTIVAPVFEEVCFRGFLVPAFAIAYDWLSLPRTPDGLARWRTTAMLTPAALIFSAIVSSIFFAWLHAEQVGHAHGILVVLFCVSLVLTFVRVKADSVASSAIVHGAYNFFVFLIVMIQTGGYRHFDRLLK
jgi:membrane protease YdiL (CAAX protease family)